MSLGSKTEFAVNENPGLWLDGPNFGEEFEVWSTWVISVFVSEEVGLISGMRVLFTGLILT